MKTIERNKKILNLKNLNNNESKILANARCLTEGVNLPELSGIAFIDPKQSQIDIIQAVGRAIRKSERKTIGTIIIPVYLGDTEQISEQIFNDETLLGSVNSLIHPRVQKAFELWLNNQNSKYIIYEAALIFENNTENIFDKIICIKTPLNIIHKRISNRENYSKKRVEKILDSQLSQDVKCSMSDFCIENTSKEKLLSEIIF